MVQVPEASRFYQDKLVHPKVKISITIIFDSVQQLLAADKVSSQIQIFQLASG
jgi:hypothetical protein